MTSCEFFRPAFKEKKENMIREEGRLQTREGRGGVVETGTKALKCESMLGETP